MSAFIYDSCECRYPWVPPSTTICDCLHLLVLSTAIALICWSICEPPLMNASSHPLWVPHFVSASIYECLHRCVPPSVSVSICERLHLYLWVPPSRSASICEYLHLWVPPSVSASIRECLNPWVPCECLHLWNVSNCECLYLWVPHLWVPPLVNVFPWSKVPHQWMLSICQCLHRWIILSGCAFVHPWLLTCSWMLAPSVVVPPSWVSSSLISSGLLP